MGPPEDICKQINAENTENLTSKRIGKQSVQVNSKLAFFDKTPNATS